MNKRCAVLTTLLAPAAVSSAYSSTSREIMPDITQLDDAQQQIFYEKLGQFYSSNFVLDGEALGLIFETNAPTTSTDKEILTSGNYVIKFAKGQEFRGEEQYSKLIEYFAKSGSIDLQLYSSLKSLTLENELLEEVSKFTYIDRDNPQKLVEACLRTVKLNAVEMYKTIEDLVGTTFIYNLCETVGAKDKIPILVEHMDAYKDINIENISDQELYREICERLNIVPNI